MIGKTISHYKILEKLGEGGMGVVYKAEDTKLKRTVALKFLPPELIRDSEAKERFIHESQTAAALNHPNICTIHEIDESESPTGVGSQSFIAMECVEGQSLKKKIESGPIKFKEALTIVAQVAEGLREAHDRGIVHRDIKSANIMVTTRGQAKIMDFGLAKLAGQTKLTKAGTTLGTVAYMSPEQARGGKVDFRTDIWSLGVVFYEMLTGELPFRGEYEQAVIYSILNVDPDPIAGIPLECERIVNCCLKKDSEKRYSSTADLQEDLKLLEQEVSSGKVPARKKKTAAPRPLPKLLRKPAVLIGGVILALLMVFVFLFRRQTVKEWLGFDEKSLAVLPFTVVGGDSTDQIFCDGLVGTFTDKLIQLERFKKSLWIVPASEVTDNEINSPSDARRVFKSVKIVITGIIRRMGDMIVLKSSLVDTKTLRQIDLLEFTDHIANISIWQNEVIYKLAQILDVELNPETQRILSAGETTVPAAFEHYVNGQGFKQHFERGDNLDAAINLFKQAVEIDTLYALAYLALGQAYQLKFENTKNADFSEFVISACQRAIQINDQSFPAYILLGKAYRAMGKYEDAIEEFRHILQNDPDNYDATRYLAIALEETGNLEKAEAIYKQAIQLRKSYWGSYDDLGVFYHYDSRNREAERMFHQATELMSEDIFAYRNLIVIYFTLGKSNLAREMFDRAIAIKQDAVAYSNMGTVDFFEGLYANAVTMYEEAIKLGEEDYTIFGNLADSYRYTIGNTEKTRRAYKEAARLTEKELEIYPEDAILRSQLARYYAILSHYKDAVTEITKAKNMAPNSSSVLRRCVLVFELANRREDALQALSEYIILGGAMEEIDKDPDLAGLRVDPRYRQLIGSKE